VGQAISRQPIAAPQLRAMIQVEGRVQLAYSIGAASIASGVGGVVVDSESAAYFEDAGPNVRTKIRDFLEITSLAAPRRPEPSFKINRIVDVEGDTRRGKKPFPHPFPARMPIEVAQSAVAALSKPGDVVLDPMVGSGVVAKAALSLGREAIGFDTDPLAIVQSMALCASVSAARFESTVSKILKTAEKALRSKNVIDAQCQIGV
jgi:DNA modification methylase